MLDLYRTRPGPLSQHEPADALAFAETASMLLLDTAAGTQPDTAELTWQRDDPTAHQAQAHQATGMILVQLGISAEAAFVRLRTSTWIRRSSCSAAPPAPTTAGYPNSPAPSSMAPKRSDTNRPLGTGRPFRAAL
ncbi:hypothetical protein ACTMTJ_40910 [Phytohabitans sp. LJ34]|uniref:hypothetical protein n=1 Tax=Phytohabitans sp. LJ34 TaxID=3452217 RepID=UPI003F891A1D